MQKAMYVSTDIAFLFLYLKNIYYGGNIKLKEVFS